MTDIKQPEYLDGTFAWAVDAVKPSGGQQRITTTLVRAVTDKDACGMGRHRLRSLIKARGYKGPWRTTARPAHPVHDLGMTEIKR